MQAYPRDWDWANEAKPRKLAEFVTAPDKIGFYELGWYKQGKFVPMYCGRARGMSLRDRLRQHFTHSHNPNVRANRDDLYFRCKAFKTEELASYVEAVTIAAFSYPWNRRNEWTQHWALET
jgi:hypothetical protein